MSLILKRVHGRGEAVAFGGLSDLIIKIEQTTAAIVNCFQVPNSAGAGKMYCSVGTNPGNSAIPVLVLL
jgi:hypothetical protein